MLRDERGFTFSLFAFGAFIILAGLILILLIPLINVVIGSYNDLISMGYISQDTHNAVQFNILTWKDLAFFALLGAGLWLINEAHKYRRLE